MKVINHQKENRPYYDDCVIGGTVVISPREFKDAIAYLKRKYQTAEKKTQTYVRDSLRPLFSGKLPEKKWGARVLGVCATKLIFDRYELPNYKEQNYRFLVK